jgi:hypothetical protein
VATKDLLVLDDVSRKIPIGSVAGSHGIECLAQRYQHRVGGAPAGVVLQVVDEEVTKSGMGGLVRCGEVEGAAGGVEQALEGGAEEGGGVTHGVEGEDGEAD